MSDEARPRPPAPPGAPTGPPPGIAVIRASLGGTVLFTLLAIGAVAADPLVAPYAIVSLLMFLGGCLACIVAFLRAVDRSRTETIGVGGLFFGAGSTPGRVQLLLVGSLVVEVVVAVAAAAMRLYSPVAFGTLAPMWALGLAGVWVARHGTFPEHEPELTRAGRRQADQAAHRRGGRTATNRATPPADGPPAPGGDDDGARSAGADGAGEGSGADRAPE